MRSNVNKQKAIDILSKTSFFGQTLVVPPDISSETLIVLSPLSNLVKPTDVIQMCNILIHPKSVANVEILENNGTKSAYIKFKSVDTIVKARNALKDKTLLGRKFTVQEVSDILNREKLETVLVDSEVVAVNKIGMLPKMKGMLSRVKQLILSILSL